MIDADGEETVEEIAKRCDEEVFYPTPPIDDPLLCQEFCQKSKLSKNDIRRFIGKMFCNTINSGNVDVAQAFTDSFITADCLMVATYDIPPQFHIPAQISTVGPLQYCHFILGSFKMFPDLVMSILNCRIESDPGTQGGGIVTMDVTYDLTKTSHLPFDLWVPSPDLLEGLYTAGTGWQLLHVIRHSHLYRRPRPSTVIPTEEGSKPTSSSGTGTSATSWQDGGAIQASSSSTAVQADHQAPLRTTTSIPCSIGANVAPLGPTGGNLAAAPARGKVPDRFAKALQQAAVPMDQPLPLRLVGTLTFHLDAQNRIQAIASNVVAEN